MYNVKMNRKYLKRKDVNLVPLRVLWFDLLIPEDEDNPVPSDAV